MKKKVISLLLAVCIVSSSFNTAFAEEVPETYSDYDASPTKNPVISHEAEDTEQNNASVDNESLVNQATPVSSDDALVSNDSDSEDIISESESPLNTEETEENIASDKTETPSDILTDPASLSTPETIKEKSESAPVTKTAIKLDTPVLTKLIKYDTIELSWTKINDAEKYYIYRKIPGGNWSQIAETTDNTYQETEHLASGQKYIYTVRAYADGVRSGYDATGLSIWNLDVPQLTEIEIVSTGISVSWDTVNAADKYCVYRKAEGAASWTSLGATTNTTYIDKERLDSAVTYIYTVRACKESSRSYFNPEGISITSLSAPELTQIVKYNTIELSWNEVPGAEKYYIYRKVPGGHWSQIATTEAPMFKEPESLTYGQEYIYTVRAVLNGKRSYYDTDGLKILNLKTPELSKTENTSNGISIKWNTVSGIDGYYVYRKADGASSWTLIGKTSQTSYIDKDALQSGIKYLYTVRAYKGSDKSYFETDGISIIKLTTPVLTKIIKYDAIELTWEEVAGAEEYYIYRKIPGGHWSQIATSKSTKYIENDSLNSGQEYVYTVRAYVNGTRSYYNTSGLSIWNLDVPQLTAAENAAGGIKVTWDKVQAAEGYYIYRKEAGASSWTFLGSGSNTYYTDKSKLVSGTDYLYTVRAYKDSSRSYFDTAGISVLNLSIPSLAKIIKYDSIELSWDKVTGASEYYVYRKVPGGHWSQIATTKNTSYTEDKNLATGQEYVYTVRAYAAGQRSYYETAGLSIWNLDVPILKSAENAAGGVKVGWQSVTKATGYYVYRKASGASSWTLLGKTSSTSYTDKTALQSGTKYLYTVRASRESSNSYFDPKGISVLYLSTPTLVGADNVSTGIKISWKSVKGAEGYKLYRRIIGGPWQQIAQLTSTNYIDKSSLTSGTKYLYTVRAYNGTTRSYYVESGVSEIKLTTPSLISAQNNSGGIKVTWQSVKGATSYRIYRKPYGGTSWKWIGTSKSASYTDESSLTSGTKYVYTVRALKSSDLSYYDPDGIAETKLNTPALTSAKKVSGGVKITWQSVKGASGYYVYRRLSGKSWTRIATTTSTSYTDKTTNINYIYTVKAYKGSDMSWYNSSGIKVITNKMLSKAQSFSSSTKWLILVDTTANKVGIYYGSKGNWTEKKYWSCTTGAASTPTVKGSFTVKSKGLAFGSGYTCWYYTQFYGNYLFHSVLYNPGSKTSIQDGRLGINASHGCVRLSLANAKWIYDNIPSGTKVYIY